MKLARIRSDALIDESRRTALASRLRRQARVTRQDDRTAARSAQRAPSESA